MGGGGAGSCVETLPKVMSCQSQGYGGTERRWELPFLLSGCVRGLGPWHRGCQHSHQHTNTHTHTRARLSILATAQGMPTHQLAWAPARWVRESRVEANRDNQWVLSCLSCSFMLSLSMRPAGARVCVRHACCLIRGKFHVTFRWRSLKGCFGV